MDLYVNSCEKLQLKYRDADKSLARPGRKQANICQNCLNLLRCLALQEKKLDDNSCLDFVEILRVPDVLRACFLPGRAKDLSAPR